MLRILIADDHHIVRQGLKALLEREQFDVFGDAADGQEAVRLARESSGWLACASVRAGLRDQALQILQDTFQGGNGPAPSRRFVQIYGCLGDTDRTFAYLEKMYVDRDSLLPIYLLYPELDFMRSDARFAVLRQKMGLAP